MAGIHAHVDCGQELVDDDDRLGTKRRASGWAWKKPRKVRRRSGLGSGIVARVGSSGRPSRANGSERGAHFLPS